MNTVPSKLRVKANRRAFLADTARWTMALGAAPAAIACASSAQAADRDAAKSPLIDTHMHVWSGDEERFPFAHPYQRDFKPPKIAATVELLVKEMDESGIDRCVLVQTICHGWDNAYLVHCLKAHPKRFRGHGLIDPTDPKVADKLEFWVRRHGLAGMRFSPIYYEGQRRLARLGRPPGPVEEGRRAGFDLQLLHRHRAAAQARRHGATFPQGAGGDRPPGSRGPEGR